MTNHDLSRLVIPEIPSEIVDIESPPAFIASPEWARWLFDAFILDGPLFNEDHQHLSGADIGVLLTNVIAKDRSQQVLGFAEWGPPSGRMFSKGRKQVFLEERFGHVPNFVLTFYAPLFAVCRSEGHPRPIGAICEHELYHCGAARWPDGSIKYDKEDKPVFAMKGHDIELHIGEVRRWGAWSDALQELRFVLARGPEVPDQKIEGICGCGARFG